MSTDKTWWNEGKFGMFIHYGLYSLLAGEYEGIRTNNVAEWIMHDLDIPKEKYRSLASSFTAEDFDAEKIVRLAKETGMKYVVLTSKHHDGFALFDSKVSDYTSVKAIHCKRNLVRELQVACQNESLRFGLYYSQAQDWDNPDACQAEVSEKGKDFERYFHNKCLPQLTELLTHYGQLDLLWLDTPMYMTKKQSKTIRDLVKGLQPNCIISGRIGNGLGDYMTTSDNFMPALSYPGDFEVPATINNTWGYNKFDTAWKSEKMILKLLVKTVSRGGNYLLNIGPMGSGKIPEASIDILKSVGSFMEKNGDSIYGTKMLPIYPYDIDWGYFTAKKGKLYLHIHEEKSKAHLLNIGNTPLRCYRLSDGLSLDLEKRTTCEGASSWLIHLPPREASETVQVICIELAEDNVIFEPLRK